MVKSNESASCAIFKTNTPHYEDMANTALR